MKYVIDRKNENLKLANYRVEISGLKVKPINKVSGLTIKAKSITLADPCLIDSDIKKRINKKINKIVNFMEKILNDDGTTDDDTGIALDEINKLKGIINKKYKEYMVKTEYDNFIKKINIVEEVFRDNYREKQYFSYLSGNYYEEDLSQGRSR